MASSRRARVQRVAEVPESPFATRRLLLDTHVWLWWQADDRRLGALARHAIRTATEVWFSAASAWEIAIKASLGKLTLPRGADIESALALDGFRPLPVAITHAEAVRTLRVLHRDPFDRMLVAQARCEGLTILTADSRLAEYDVPLLSATEN